MTMTLNLCRAERHSRLALMKKPERAARSAAIHHAFSAKRGMLVYSALYSRLMEIPLHHAAR